MITRVTKIRVIFLPLINKKMYSTMAKRETRLAVPAEMLSKEFLSQFKSEKDVSQFLKDLHSQVLEHMLQG